MKKQILIEKFIKKLDFTYTYQTNNERQNIIEELYEIAGIEQLDLPVVVRQSEQLCACKVPDILTGFTNYKYCGFCMKYIG